MRLLNLCGLCCRFSDDTWQIFKDKKPSISFRGPRNLADNLVRSKIKRSSGKAKGMRKCGKPRCQICNYVEEVEKFVYDKYTYWINYSFDCDSEGVIYVLIGVLVVLRFMWEAL